jgi:hypothetical protein
VSFVPERPAVLRQAALPSVNNDDLEQLHGGALEHTSSYPVTDRGRYKLRVRDPPKQLSDLHGQTGPGDAASRQLA